MTKPNAFVPAQWELLYEFYALHYLIPKTVLKYSGSGLLVTVLLHSVDQPGYLTAFEIVFMITSAMAAYALFVTRESKICKALEPMFKYEDYLSERRSKEPNDEQEIEAFKRRVLSELSVFDFHSLRYVLKTFVPTEAK